MKPRRRRAPREYVCRICEKALPHCWTCRCGFMICADCFTENAWGMTCNFIHWECPDCGRFNVF